MYRTVSIISVITIAVGTVSCDTAPAPQRELPPSEERSERVDPTRLAEADAAKTNPNEAESRFRLETEEARAIREEAKQTAEQQLRQASVLLRVVDAIVSHDPPNRYALPSDDELQEMRRELDQASAAFVSGDYLTAGLMAQSITDKLSGSVRTTT